MLSLSPGHVFPYLSGKSVGTWFSLILYLALVIPWDFTAVARATCSWLCPNPFYALRHVASHHRLKRHPELVVEEITPLLFPSNKPCETQNHIELEQDEMATACTVAQYLKCVNLEVEGGFSEVQGERFSWGLGSNLRWGLRSIAERCTWLRESNMRALLKDLCVSLPLVLFRYSQADKDLSHILFGLSKVEASLNM